MPNPHRGCVKVGKPEWKEAIPKIVDEDGDLFVGRIPLDTRDQPCWRIGKNITQAQHKRFTTAKKKKEDHNFDKYIQICRVLKQTFHQG